MKLRILLAFEVVLCLGFLLHIVIQEQVLMNWDLRLDAK
jgi:hypothetical protein